LTVPKALPKDFNPQQRTKVQEIIGFDPKEDNQVRRKSVAEINGEIDDYKKEMENNKRWASLNKTLEDIQNNSQVNQQVLERLKISVDNNLNLLDEKVNFIGRSLMDMKSGMTTSSFGVNLSHKNMTDIPEEVELDSDSDGSRPDAVDINAYFDMKEKGTSDMVITE